MRKSSLELTCVFGHRTAPPLFGRESSPEESTIIVVGVPFDSATTTTPGQREAPRAIRRISLELETFDPRSGVDVEDAPFYDAGDIPLEVNHEKLEKTLYQVASEIFSSSKTPLLIGGDHFVTLPAVKAALSTFGRLHLIVFDAHLDLRDEYPLGTKYSHATLMRRLLESPAELRLTYFKPRAFSREEYSYATSDSRVKILGRAEDLLEEVGRGEKIYISIDMDIVDPAFAPGVGVPEPLGLYPRELVQVLDDLLEVSGKRVIGVDLVEVNPLLDVNNITSALAAKLLMQVILKLSKNR